MGMFCQEAFEKLKNSVCIVLGVFAGILSVKLALVFAEDFLTTSTWFACMCFGLFLNRCFIEFISF